MYDAFFTMFCQAAQSKRVCTLTHRRFVETFHSREPSLNFHVQYVHVFVFSRYVFVLTNRYSRGSKFRAPVASGWQTRASIFDYAHTDYCQQFTREILLANSFFLSLSLHIPAMFREKSI